MLPQVFFAKRVPTIWSVKNTAERYGTVAILLHWLMASAAGIPVAFFGLFTLPDLLPRDDYLFERLIDIHKWLAWLLVFFMFVHVGAALRHHFVFKDDTLRKMLP